ncbi:MAG: Holliday junction branch migration protein RuvA [Alphaproteobacteria bacterium]|nr:Holliday junction branch migration protein RuvA [Alphaproteobacteria bacterium]
MIAKLHGIIDTIGEDSCIIDVNGVGYLVSASAKTLAKLNVGAEASLLTVMTVREDDISLFGFADAWEKEWFNTLTKVQGVGAKVCLSILSVLTPTQLAQAINAQDKASFCRASGVGPKLAARIVTELKDKIVTVPVAVGGGLNAAIAGTSATDLPNESTVSTQPAVDYTKSEDVTSALVNLGYQRLEAYHAASRVLAKNPDADVATLIRLALKEFAGKEFEV